MFAGRQAIVAMMKSAHFAKRNDLSFFWPPHRARLRGIFVQDQMRPTPVITSEIGFKQTVQVKLVEDGDVIQTFVADRTHQPLNVRRLPGRTKRIPGFLQTQSLGAAPELQAVNSIGSRRRYFEGEVKAKASRSCWAV